MAEESAAPSTSADKTESMDADGEAKKLLGLGQKNLVMGDIPAAVNAFQEAASLLGKTYGETANECAEAFFFYGKALLELARVENGVLGNALEGVQVEEEEEKAEEKAEDAMVESADNIDEEAREELREQVYNAMGEKNESRKTAEESLVQIEAETQLKNKDMEMEEVKEEKVKQTMDIEHTTLKERKEEGEKTEKQDNAQKQVEMTVKEKEVELSPEIALEVSDAVKEKVAVEDSTGGKSVVEEAGEDTTEKKDVTAEEAAGEEKPVTTETAGEDATVKKKPVTVEEADGEEKPVEIGALEKMEEEAEKLVALATKQVEINPIVEEPVKVSGEAVEEKELVAAVKKVEGKVETAIENAERQPARAIDGKIEKMETTEQVDMDSKEKEELEEPLVSTEASSASKSMPAEGTEPSHKIQTEEKVEVAAKVEKEEEKDDQMGEGEETEGSEDDDKAGEDRENDSAVEEKESEDDVGNLELAWDMLELAKVIYKRQDTKEAQLHAAQAHLKLGEVSIESENYTQAIEEFHSCLTLQQKYLEAHDRLLAESYYHLGLAYHYNSQFDEAVLYYSKSVEVIDKRMVMLNERLKADGSIEDESEYVELEELLPEIQEKIEDSKESQKNARAAGLALKATLVGGGSSSSFSQGTESSLASTMPVGQTADGASKCITDISHLVRKKRKPEEETQQGDNEAKKSKPEPAVNGGGDAAPSGNEIAEKMEEETEERPQVETVQTAV
ncbi:nuclear autoantigenic sperm protein isoform X2 [Hemicordylus capensis]|nr:nuclear autoantigenic sperm protein isoform X2 [Hemicordylus capensis]XP_053100282.1 nuclear autoantigenic sperm protein isoform X2 [Hemicordylus capensis]